MSKFENEKVALVIEVNGKLLDKINNLLSKLKDKFSIEYISSRSPSPHIAISYGFIVNDMPEFSKLLENFLSQRERFVLKTNGIGVFAVKAPVVYLRWSSNKYLINLKCDLENYLLSLKKSKVISSYCADLNWVPKTTLAYNDSSYSNLQIVLESIAESNISGSILVNSMSIYTYSESSGEKAIKKIHLI